MFSPIWGKGNGRGIPGFAVNRGAVNRGFTVSCLHNVSHSSCRLVVLSLRNISLALFFHVRCFT